jgi:hypothetical protein
MISITGKGDFSKTFKFLNFVDKFKVDKILEKYGQQGVSALAAATPINSGQTANSWNYTIKNSGSSYSIHWNNTNVNNGVNIAVIIQYGHGTGTGGYVQGIDYINPAMRPIFDKIAEEAWREVVKA